MSPIRIIILAVAALASVGAALLVRSMVSEPAEPAVLPTQVVVAEAPPEPETQILVVNRALRRGETLTPEDLEWVSWPEKALNPAFVTNELDPDAIDTFTGHLVRFDHLSLEPVQSSKLVDPEDRGYLAASLKEGMRAISVGITAESASGGFILPGDRVDVLLTHSVLVSNPNEDAEPVTTVMTIIRNARVLAIDQRFTPDPENPTQIGSVATLELPEEAAEVITLGGTLGELSLALRSLADAEIEGEIVQSLDRLLEIFGDPYGGAGNVAVYRNGAVSLSFGGR